MQTLSFRSKLDPVLRGFVDAIFPRRCLGCSRVGFELCDRCLAEIPILKRKICPGCERPYPDGALCRACRSRGDWALEGLWVVSPYQKGGLLQKAVKSMKYRHFSGLGERLGTWMGEHFRHFERSISPSVNDEAVQEWILCPVPLHAERERTRGYNQAYLLARAVSRVCGLSFSDRLKRVRPTPPQAERSRHERLINLNRAFSFKGRSPPWSRNVILVDDVCSTGATLNGCARVLKQAGVERVWGLVLARGVSKVRF